MERNKPDSIENRQSTMVKEEMSKNSNTVFSIFIFLGLGDAWGHRVIYTNPKEKELGSHLLQVS